MSLESSNSKYKAYRVNVIVNYNIPRTSEFMPLVDVLVYNTESVRPEEIEKFIMKKGSEVIREKYFNTPKIKKVRITRIEELKDQTKTNYSVEMYY